MKIVIPPFHERISSFDNPFDHDVLNRRIFAKNLTRLLSNSDAGLVITINAKWGDGKTTFIKLWETELRKDYYNIPIYYNAFKNDFAGDPFLSIAAKIHEEIKKKFELEGKRYKSYQQLKYFKKTTKRLAKELVKMGFGLTIGSLSSGLINISQLKTWFENSIKKLVFGTLEVNIDEKFESYSNAQSVLKEYQAMLTSLLEPDKQHTNSKSRRIFFFIDELDRCRPSFAVEILEKVKHLFQINNVHFILAINGVQLLSTIANVYGVSKEEANIYLQKFVHFETKFPPINWSGEENQIAFLISKLYDDYEIADIIYTKNTFVSTLTDLAKPQMLNLNPRAIERILTYIAIAINSCDKDTAKDYAKHFLVMSALKVSESDLYESCKDGKIKGRSQNNAAKYFEWLKDYYKGEREDEASNVFKVQGLPEACKILDIYEIPKETTYYDTNVEILKNSPKSSK